MLVDEKVVANISVPGGTEVGVAIPCRPRGVVTKLVVFQQTGTLAGFTYTLYNASAACPPGTSPTVSATAPELLHTVAGPVAVASAKAAYDGGEWPHDGKHGLWLPYHNMDKALDPSDSFESPYLYLKIVAAGTGAKTFGYAVSVGEAEYPF